MSQHELMPAITLMEKKVDEAERKASELLSALNVLRGEAGMPPRALGGKAAGQASAEQLQIKSDTFFGMKQQTAMRRYLEMRRAQGDGPAKPREIYDALLEGGYKFEAKNADVALVGLRAVLRKRTETFVALNNGAYGLCVWYPELKRKAVPSQSNNPFDNEDDDESDNDAETAADDESTAA